MITVNYRPHTPMEQDILVGVLLAMYMGNDIPDGEQGSGFKWCPLRNTLTHTACTVTRVSARRTTRGHCRQDIPLGMYDRKQRRWTLKGNHTEVAKLMSLIKKGDDVSLAVLEKMLAAPWKARPPNARMIANRCEERDDPWENIPQEDDCTSEMSEDTPQADDHREASHAPTQTQSWRQRDLPAWQDLIESSLEELTTTFPDQYKGMGPNSQDQSRPGTANTQETLKLMHTLTHDPEGRQTTNAYFDALYRSGYGTLATEGRTIVRNIVAGEAESMALREWIHRLNTITGDKNVRKKVTVMTQNLGPSGIFRAMHVIADTLAMGPQVICFQDILIHGQDIRSVRKSIGDINPDYQVFSDHGSFAPDDFRKQNYAGLQDP